MVGRELFRLAWPAVVSAMVSQATRLITILFVGMLDDEVLLGAVGLGAVAQNVLGFSLGVGLSSGLETLLSQSHGAGEHELLGLFLRQAQVVCLVVCVPSVVCLSFSSDLFLLLGKSPTTARDAGEFVRGTLPGMPLFFLYTTSQTFLRSVKITRPDFYVNVVAILVHPVWCIVFLSWLRLGALGAGLTVTCSNGLRFCLLNGYILAARPEPCRRGWSCCPWPCRRGPAAAARGRDLGYRAYLEVARPSALLLWSEWWVYEVMCLLAYYCGVDSLAAHVAVSSVLTFLFMVPTGLGAALSSLVGNAIGQNDPWRAGALVRAACRFVVVLFLLVGAAVLALRRPVARLFSKDEAVVALFARLCLVMAPFAVLDAWQTVLEGALRGLGLQRRASTVKLVSMVAVRLIGAYLLAIWPVRLGVVGIWLAGTLGMVVTLIGYGHIWRSTSMEVIAQGVQERLRPAQSRPPSSELASA